MCFTNQNQYGEGSSRLSSREPGIYGGSDCLLYLGGEQKPRSLTETGNASDSDPDEFPVSTEVKVRHFDDGHSACGCWNNFHKMKLCAPGCVPPVGYVVGPGGIVTKGPSS
ncbi:hypothetical protein H072_10248 [Dactylellina haptotyla CBS 200.50]|uniref:Uncharacterized protein n=1 Tax=Dactylellina haptotyla (strain CBS 200.50) TaxID=1284197 RepID=S8A0F3_DACHA|nr:hypothetical protein H072_10248 [Dactylellina haptotyla CBS 200.50]